MTPAAVDLPPVLIRGADEIWLNPGMSAKDAAALHDADHDADLEELRAAKATIRFLLFTGTAISSAGIAATASIATTKHQPLGLDLGFSLHSILVIVGAAIFTAAATINHRVAPLKDQARARQDDLVPVEVFSRYGHYPEVRTLIESLQRTRAAAATLWGDGREKVRAAIEEALPLLHAYATTPKPGDADRTSARNAIDAAWIIARHEGAHP